MAASWQEYFDFLEKLGGELEKLTAICKEKTDAVRHDDLMAVNDCMKKEQVISLTLRTMDRRREKMLAELGAGDIPLSGLPEVCPEELRLQARKTSEKLLNRYALYRSAADVSRTTLECNLHQIEKILAEAQDTGDGNLADIRA